MNDKFVVFEYNKNASSIYVGVRYISLWIEPIILKPDSNVDIIEENISEERAYYLVSQAKKKNEDAFIESLSDYFINYINKL